MKDDKLMEALALTFNNPLVQKLSNDDYKEYILSILSLSLGTVIMNEGHDFAANFCEDALNCKESMPVVQQHRPN